MTAVLLDILSRWPSMDHRQARRDLDAVRVNGDDKLLDAIRRSAGRSVDRHCAALVFVFEAAAPVSVGFERLDALRAWDDTATLADREAVLNTARAIAWGAA